MAKFKLFLVIAIVIALFYGCAENPEAVPTTLPAADHFDQITQWLSAQPLLLLEHTESTTMTYGDNIYSYKDQKQILLNTSNGDFYSTGTIHYHYYQIHYTELHTDRTLYLTVNNRNFSGTHSGIHVPLPQMGMFTNYSAITEEDTAKIHFHDPSGSFLQLPQHAEIITAEGKLTEKSQSACTLEYNIIYKANQATFETAITIHYSTATAQIPAPDADAYIPLAHVLAPLALEKSYGLLCQSTHLSATCTKEIRHTVNTLDYMRHITMSRQKNSGTILTKTTLTDYSRRNEQIATVQEEIFQNGCYTIATDGQTKKFSLVDQTQFFNYFSQLLSKNILSPKYITNAKTEDHCVTLSLEVNHALAESICQEISQTLYHNRDFLNTQSDGGMEYLVNYCITIDPITGLPLSCILEFTSQHMIASIPYPLTARYEQTIEYA